MTANIRETTKRDNITQTRFPHSENLYYTGKHPRNTLVYSSNSKYMVFGQQSRHHNTEERLSDKRGHCPHLGSCITEKTEEPLKEEQTE